jgi:cell division septation protein DedD
MKFRYWLLAAIVLVALAVIFKPFTYRMTNSGHPIFQEVTIPKKNNMKVIIDTREIDKNFLNQQHSLGYSASSTSTTQGTTPAHPESVVMKNPFQKPVVLQVGSYTSADAAEKMVQQLKTKGYQAYQEKDDEVYHVYVGPILGLDKANQQKTSLEKDIQTKTVIMEYLPIKDLK